MKTRLVLRPGDKGTKKVLNEFGERLYCVRYRYDEVGRRRIKTAEIILEEVAWEPPHHPRYDSVRVRIRLGRAERELQCQVKEAGGQWKPHALEWELELKQVRRLGLEGRIVREG